MTIRCEQHFAPALTCHDCSFEQREEFTRLFSDRPPSWWEKVHRWLWRRYRPRKTPYSAAEMQWASSQPQRPIDLAMVVDSSMDTVRRNIDDIVGALLSLPHHLDAQLAWITATSDGCHVQPLTSDLDSVRKAILASSPQPPPATVGGWDQALFSLQWRPQAARFAIWWAANPPSPALADTCRDAGIVLHTVPCKPAVEARPSFATVARVTGGACAPITSSWLLMPLMVAPRDPNVLRLEAEIAARLAVEDADEAWAVQVVRRREEGFQELFVQVARQEATIPNAVHYQSKTGRRWELESDNFIAEVLTRDGRTFTYSCRLTREDALMSIYIYLPMEALKKHSLRVHDRVLVRPYQQ